MRSLKKSWILEKKLIFFTTSCLIGTCSFQTFSQKPKLILPFGHSDKILTAEFSPDSKRFITGSADQTAKLWDTGSSKILANFIGHDDQVSNALYSSNGKFIVTAGGSKAFVWDAISGTRLRELKEIESFITTVKISPDSKYALVGLSNGKLNVYEIESGVLIKVLNCYLENQAQNEAVSELKLGLVEIEKQIKEETDEDEKKELEDEKKEILKAMKMLNGLFKSESGIIPLAVSDVSNITFSKDGISFFTCVNDIIKIWNLKSLILKKEIKRPGMGNLFGEFDSSNTSILTYTLDGYISTWNIKTGKEMVNIGKDLIGKNIYAGYLQNGNIVIVFSNGKLRIHDFKTGKKIKELFLSSSNGPIINAKRIGQGNEVFTAYDNGKIEKCNLEDGKKLIDFVEHQKEIVNFNFSNEFTKLISFSQDNIIDIWDLKKGNLVSEIRNSLNDITSAFFSEDNKSIIVNQKNQTINIWNPLTGENINNIKHKEKEIEFARLANDNKKIIISLNNGNFKEMYDEDHFKSVDEKAQIKYSHQFGYRNGDYQFIEKKYPTAGNNRSNLGNLKQLQSFINNSNIELKNNIRISTSPIQPILKTLSFYSEDDENNDNTRKRNEIHNQGDGILNFAKFSSDGEKLLVASSEMRSFLYNSNDTRNLIRELEGHENTVNYVDFSRTGKIALTASHDGTAKIWNLGYGNTPPISLIGHLSKVYSVQFNKDETKLITASADNTFKIWNTKQGKEIASFFSLDDQKLFTYLPSGYYSGSPTNVKKLHYVTDKLDIISFEQLDVRFNRPDKVLEALGSDNTELIKAYKQAYLKRIIKLGIDTTTFQNEIYVPELNIVEVDKISKNQSKEKINLRIVAKDAKSKINNLNIKINEVPLFGLKGLKINNRTSIDTTLSIDLMYGENRIEAYVRNSNGLESYKKPLTLIFNPIQTPKEKVYFIGLGIDQFKDKSNNLSYSVNDIRALSTELRKKFGENLEIDTLINLSLNIDNLKKIKQKLLKSNINDKVIIAYSGHGMTDNNKDYFLSTYSMNFNNPRDGGLRYEEIENLIDGIPARKKLVLLDACQSGEIDKGNKVQEPIIELGDKKNKGKKKSVKGPKPETNTKTNETGLLNSFELMQNLFVNLGNNTGANVLTASKGDKSAYENPSLKHGVFTYFILDAIKKNKSLTISELKNWVFEKVSIASKKSQIPSSRSETILFDWNLW